MAIIKATSSTGTNTSGVQYIAIAYFESQLSTINTLGVL